MRESFPLNSVKYLDYLAFKKVAEFILHNKHHSPEGLKTITTLQNTMNSLRIGKPRTRVDSHSSQAMVTIEFNQIALLRNVIIPAFKALTLEEITILKEKEKKRY